MAIAPASDIAQIESILGDDAESLLEHTCSTISSERLHLPGPDFVDRVVAMSDRPTPVLRSLQTLYSNGRLAGTGYLSILPGRPGHRALGRCLLRQEPRLLRPGPDRRARDRGRLQRRRHHARRARRHRPPLRAPDPVPAQAEPQRVPVLPERVRPDHVRLGAPGPRAGLRRRRRDDLLRLPRVEAPDPGGVGGVRGRARAGHGDRALVLPAQLRLLAEGRRPRLPPGRRPDHAGQPPGRHHRGRHHQAEGARDRRGPGSSTSSSARPTSASTPSS